MRLGDPVASALSGCQERTGRATESMSEGQSIWGSHQSLQRSGRKRMELESDGQRSLILTLHHQFLVCSGVAIDKGDTINCRDTRQNNIWNG